MIQNKTRNIILGVSAAIVISQFLKRKKPNLSVDITEKPSIQNSNIYQMKVPQTKNFKLKEFESKDGSETPIALYGNIQRMMEQLEILRSHLGDNPIYITSGYRSPAHNKKVGGAARSQHLDAKAVDITVKGYSPFEVQRAITYLMKEGLMQKGGLGIYKNFTHYDIGSPRSWIG